jgi:hypothetical protein
MAIKTRKKIEDTETKLREVAETTESEQTTIRAAERSTKAYEKNKEQRITERSVEKIGKDLASDTADLTAKIENKEHTEEDVFNEEYNGIAIMGLPALNDVAKVLRSADYSNRKTRKIAEEAIKRGREAYLRARMQDKSGEEAKEAARNAQIKYLATIYALLDKEHQRDFEKAVGNWLGQQEVGALALKSGNEDAINDAFNATDSDSQRGVVKKYQLMSEFAAAAFFASMAAVFSVSGARGAFSGPDEVGAHDDAISYYFDEVMQKEQWQQEETGNFEALDEMIAELIEEDKKRGESNDGEAPKVSDLDEKVQGTLEKFGISPDTTLKDAAEIMENAKQSMEEKAKAVNELRSEEYFARRGEDVEENVKIPPFYKEETALEIIEQGKRGAISESPSEFLSLAAVEFEGDGSLRRGTLDELPGEHDFGNPKSPEAVVLASLKSPQDGVARQAAAKVLSNPVNLDVRAALIEAFARAKEELERGRNRAG